MCYAGSKRSVGNQGKYGVTGKGLPVRFCRNVYSLPYSTKLRVSSLLPAKVKRLFAIIHFVVGAFFL